MDRKTGSGASQTFALPSIHSPADLDASGFFATIGQQRRAIYDQQCQHRGNRAQFWRHCFADLTLGTLEMWRKGEMMRLMGKLGRGVLG